MSIYRFCGLAAAAASLVAIPAPSFAAVDTDFGTNPVLDQMCDDLLNPADQSGFTTYAIVTGETEDVSEVANGPTVRVGYGATTTTYSFANAHQNGKSVNIHADATKTVKYEASRDATPMLETTKHLTTADCHVHKKTNGNDRDPLHEGYNIQPNGLQRSVSEVTSTSTREYIKYGDVIPGEWIDPNASGTASQVVICISPGKVPGTWRAQNNYDGSLGICSRAFYDSLPASTPSVSVPAT